MCRDEVLGVGGCWSGEAGWPIRAPKGDVLPCLTLHLPGHAANIQGCRSDCPDAFRGEVPPLSSFVERQSRSSLCHLDHGKVAKFAPRCCACILPPVFHDPHRRTNVPISGSPNRDHLMQITLAKQGTAHWMILQVPRAQPVERRAFYGIALCFVRQFLTSNAAAHSRRVRPTTLQTRLVSNGNSSAPSAARRDST
jgi:hypothetical protein